MANQECDLGLIGLGVMGGNLVLNMADHGFSVAVYNRTAEKTREFMEKQAAGRNIQPGYTLTEFIGLLRRPRSIVLLVRAGAPVDAVIEELVPLLDQGDLLIDSGNSHFTDTDRRDRQMTNRGRLFMGMGISGGEAGARYGPSIMPGGPREAYERVRPVLEAISAQVQGEPCAAYMGKGSGGHYVKMVHNGIEYAIMQLIAETYDLMRRGCGMSATATADVYEQWNQTELASYLIEILVPILRRTDDQAPGTPLIDRILDQARQKGTGMWMSQNAMDLQVPIPSIDAAVMMRNLSTFGPERQAASGALHGPETRFRGDRKAFLSPLKNALYAGMVLAYAQGLALLTKASVAYNYGLDLEAVARIWRGGCIIRAALLEPIRKAYQARPDLPNLMLDPHLGREIDSRQADLRTIVASAVDLGLPVPGLMASLAYFDAYRSARLPTNLTQAQRDYFGAHTYERTDRPGIFHTDWSEN